MTAYVAMKNSRGLQDIWHSNAIESRVWYNTCGGMADRLRTPHYNSGPTATRQPSACHTVCNT